MNNSAKYDRENRPPGHASSARTLSAHSLSNHNKRLLALVLVLCLLLPSLSGCFKFIDILLAEETSQSASAPSASSTRPAITTSRHIVIEPSPTPTQAPEESLFDQEKTYLADNNIGLAGKDSDSFLTNSELQELVIQVYEALVGEVDISQSNPNYAGSDTSKKLLRLEQYHPDYCYANRDYETRTVDYLEATLLLLKIFQKMFDLQAYDENDNLSAEEILDFLNIGTALVDWTADKSERSTLDMEELIGKGTAEIKMQALDKIIAARMLVNAIESILDFELPTLPDSKPKDTDDIFAWKAPKSLFFKLGDEDKEDEKDKFNPEHNILKNDAYQVSCNYTVYLLMYKGIGNEDCPYGAIVSALAALVEAGKNFDIPVMHELTVLNEKPYAWHVSQYETGEHGRSNCMPTCVEMAFRFQNLADFPSAEMMREQYPVSSEGWTTSIAIELMEKYGLDFTIGDTREYNDDELFAELLKVLDEGNIIYVLYRREALEYGHAIIIKGYYMYGDLTKFIICDPSSSGEKYGPYAYIEYLKDSYPLLADMRRNEPPFYFVIPPSQAHNVG